jgi:hypothetical protein
MKKVFAVTTAITLLVLAAVSVGAGTFTATLLPANGLGMSLYAGGSMSSASLPFDFGFSFSSINSISLHWAADIYDGQGRAQIWVYDPFGGHWEDVTWTVQGEINITTGSAQYTGVSMSEYGTHYDRLESPSVQQWDLMSGHSTVNVNLYANSVGPYTPPPHAYLSLLSVTVDGTAVPEPSSIIALLGGLAGLLGMRRRRA